MSEQILVQSVQWDTIQENKTQKQTKHLRNVLGWGKDSGDRSPEEPERTLADRVGCTAGGPEVLFEEHRALLHSSFGTKKKGARRQRKRVEPVPLRTSKLEWTGKSSPFMELNSKKSS